MGFEKGSLIIFDKKFWLFAGYSTDKDMHQTYILHGLNGEVIEPLAVECFHLLSPSEVDFKELIKNI